MIIIHIGFHKTATSTFQKIIRENQNLLATGVVFRDQASLLGASLSRYAYGLVSSAEVQEIIIDEFEKNPHTLVSVENLSGVMGSYSSQCRCIDLLQFVVRTFNDVKIVFCVKDFDATLKSCWGEFLRSGDIQSFAGFCSTSEKDLHFDGILLNPQNKKIKCSKTLIIKSLFGRFAAENEKCSFLRVRDSSEIGKAYYEAFEDFLIDKTEFVLMFSNTVERRNPARGYSFIANTGDRAVFMRMRKFNLSLKLYDWLCSYLQYKVGYGDPRKNGSLRTLVANALQLLLRAYQALVLGGVEILKEEQLSDFSKRQLEEMRCEFSRTYD